MLVYGDHREFADPRERLDGIAGRVRKVSAMRAGIERHAKLVGALIEAGQLLQGVADAHAPAEELNLFVHRLAQALARSHDSNFADLGELASPPPLKLPRWVELRLPEGFAFYSVYPEAYIAAARRLRLAGPPRVIGIRSIGTTLGACVAAALDAPPQITVRPFGDPFARRTELRPDVVEEAAHYVIVDEGPGLSGSSFGSVADWLESHGVPSERIAFVPSHGGDLGPQASAAHRERWRRVQRVAAEFDARFLSDLVGPLQPFSTGHPWERRKYLATVDGERVLLKFAGLGAIGWRKLQMARTLHAAGFTPEPLGLVHGFLVERWRDDALPLAEEERPVEEIARYIGARARLFPADEASGATIDELLTMCRRNLSIAFGETATRALDRWNPTRLSSRIARVRTDNKLDRREWLQLPGGGLLKADAVDHHQAHDLIGCQDMAWDVAGATIEFDLDNEQGARLAAATGRSIDPELLEFYRLVYCAFRLGAAHLAGEAGASSALEPSRRFYADRARHLLHQYDCCGIPQESSVG